MEHNGTVPTGRSDKSPPFNARTNPLRILVVDDDDAIRSLSQEVLAKVGYHVDAAEDGAVAWDTLQLNRYDLMVTDNQMPKVTGVELLQKIRDFKLTMPVILATGTLPEGEFLRRPWLEPAATLIKPFSPDELLRTVETVLSASRDREQA